MSIITTEWICTHCKQSYTNNRILNQKCLYCGKGTVIERRIQTYTQSEVDELIYKNDLHHGKLYDDMLHRKDERLVSLREKLKDKLKADSELTRAFDWDKSWIKEDVDSVFDSVLKGDEK